MGIALRDGYRQKAFLMTKFDGRTRQLAAQQIDESLQRLQTDHIDLMQFHENIRLEDPDRFFAEGGARSSAGGEESGEDPLHRLCRPQRPYRPPAHAGADGPAPVPFRFLPDAAERHGLPFPQLRAPGASQTGRAGHRPLAMKTMGSGAIVRSGTVTPIECLHYALNLPTAVVITGMESMERVDQAIEVVRTFKPMSAAEVATLVARTRDAALTGRCELFKTSNRFDGTAHNPQWMG